MTATQSFFIVLFLLLCTIERNYGYRLPKNNLRRKTQRCIFTTVHAERKKSPSSENLGGNTLSRGLFNVAELFGSVMKEVTSDKTSKSTSRSSLTRRSTKDIAQLIKSEYEAIFWATGNMDTSLWADTCTFADPFSSFGGPGARDRFKKNADNLGRLVIDPTLKITSFVVDDNLVKVGWIFSSKLALPWKPVLAAAGETSHYLDETTGLIIRYEESWKSNPWDVVKRLFQPSK